MKKLRILILVSLITTLLTNTSYAGSLDKIDYKSALEIAINSSESLKTYSAKIKTAEDRYYNACSIAIDAKYKTGKSDVEQIEYRNQELLYPIQYFNALTYLKQDNEDVIRSLKIELTDRYFTLFIINKQIDMQSKTVNNIKKELEASKLRLKTGKITDATYENIQNNLDIEIFNLDQLRRKRLSAVIAINSLLGYKLDSEIALTEPDIPEININVSFDSQQIEDLILSNQKSDRNVKKLRDELEEAKIQLKNINENTNNRNYPGKEVLEDTITNSPFKINNALMDVDVSIRKEYNTILNLADDVEVNKIRLEIAKKNENIAHKMYKLGSIEYSDLVSKASQRDQAEILLLQAKLDLFIQSIKFSNYLDE